MADSKKHFVLVHGACHGAWCWYKLATLLDAAGHRVTAVDLAGAGVNPKRQEDVESLADYLSPLMDVLAALPSGERVILVGHSMGGIGISIAAEALPENIAATVYVAAGMPSPAVSVAQSYREFFRRNPPESLLDTQFTFDRNNLPVTMMFGPRYISSKLYQLCSPEDLRLALMLMRPTKLFAEELEAAVLTEKRFGSIPRVYVVCKEDNLMGEDFQRWIIDKTSVSEVMELEGADHMAMLSKPQELFDIIVMAAEKYSGETLITAKFELGFDDDLFLGHG